MRNFAQDNRKMIGFAGATLAGAGIGAASSFLGGERANAASAKQAALNRDFQERMTRNKHQYEVKDLRAAGLNPILSAQAGAAVPSGATAQQKDTITPALNSALQVKQVAAQIANLQAETNLKKQDLGIKRPVEILMDDLATTALSLKQKTKNWIDDPDRALVKIRKIPPQHRQHKGQSLKSDRKTTPRVNLPRTPDSGWYGGTFKGQ